MVYPFQMYRKWIVVICLLGRARAREKNEYMMAYDCDDEKNIRISDIHSLCTKDPKTGAAVNIENMGRGMYSLIQKVEIVETSAFRCSVSLSVFYVYCGTSSWAKIVAPPKIDEPGTQLTATECKRFVAQKMYYHFHRSYPVDASGILYMDSTTPKVWWDSSRSNWHCTGGEAFINGARYSHLTVLKRIKIQGEEITVRKLKLTDDSFKLIDTNNNLALPEICGHKACVLPTMTYVLKGGLSNCFFQTVQTLSLSMSMWNIFEHDLLINSTKKIALLKKEEIKTSSACGHVGLFSTQFADLFLHSGEAKLKHISASNIDIELEVRLISFFNDVSSYSNLKFGLLNFRVALCNLIVSGFQDTALYLNGNQLVRRRGELIEFLPCKAVNVTVRMGEKFEQCFKDTFPVWRGVSLLYMDVRTRTLQKTPGLSRTPCIKKNLPVMKTMDGRYIINDGTIRHIMVHTSPIKLLEEKNLLFEHEWAETEPEYVYDLEDVSAWRNDLLIQAHQRSISTHITREVCHRSDSCVAQTYTDDDLVKNTFAGFLKELSPTGFIHDLLERASFYGGLLSLVVIAIYVLKTVMDVIVNLWRGHAIRRILYVLMCFHLFWHEEVDDRAVEGRHDDVHVRRHERDVEIAPYPL